MSSWIFLKVFSDLSLCYALLGAFPTVFPHSFSCLWPPLLCGIGAAIAAYLTDQGKDRFRFAALLLPASLLLLAGTWLEALLLLPAVAYGSLVIMRCELALEYYSYRHGFVRGLIGIVCAYFGSFIYRFLDSLGSRGNIELDQQTLLVYGLLYAVSGFALLLQLRIGSGSGRQDRVRTAGQMAAVLGSTGVLLVGLMALERRLQDSAASVLQLLWKGLSLLFGSIGLLLSRLFTREMKEFKDSLETVSTSVGTEPPLPDFTTGYVSATQDRTQVETTQHPWWMAALLLAAVLAVLIVMIKAFRANGLSASSDQTLEKVDPPAQGRKPAPRSNRAKVRRYYREFLKTEQKRGMKLHTNQTSADILDKVSDKTDSAAAAQLREVYLRARYDEKSEISPDDVKKAKNAQRKTKEGS